MNKIISDVKYPIFLPDATYGSVRSTSFNDLKTIGTPGVVTTTLHIENVLGSEYIKRFGGIKKFFGWDNLLLTDSGGWQVFSLINSKKTTKNKATEAGCSFIDEHTGKQRLLTPESSIQIQANLDSDIMTVLDFPILGDASFADRKECVRINTLWAKRAKIAFENIYGSVKQAEKLLGAVIQGGNDFELRRQSADELLELDLGLYNFGGLPMHTPITWKTQSEVGFYHDMLQYVSELIPNDKIKYAMGVGQPIDIAFCVDVGWKIFDTVLPTRNARHGFLYVSEGQGEETKTYKKLSHDILRVKKEDYKFDDAPVDANCNCECCSTVSRAYLRHLIRVDEPAGFRLASIHNLGFYQNWMEKLILPT